MELHSLEVQVGSMYFRALFVDSKHFAGMPGCLSVGMNAAKTLAAAMGKPLVGVNHMVLSYS
jgi:hypothetical protein